MSLIAQFLDKIKNEEYKVVLNNDTLPTNNTALIKSAIQPMFVDAMVAELNDRIYFDIFQPSATEIDNGLLYDRASDGDKINRPVKIKKDSKGRYWVSNYYKEFSIFDDNFSYLGGFGQYGDPAINDIYIAQSGDFYIDEERNQLVVVYPTRHAVRCYDLTTQSKKWDVGIMNAAGYLNENKLYIPAGIDKLPNGNYIVVTTRGKYYDKENDKLSPYNDGLVLEINADTGEIVSQLLARLQNGYPWNGEIYSPKAVRVVGNYVYIADGRDEIPMFEYVDGKLKYVKTYAKPKGIGVGSLGVTHFEVNTDLSELAAYADGLKLIAGIHLDTNDLTFAAGYYKYEDNVKDHMPNAINSIKGFIYDDDGNFIACDYGNNKIIKIYRSNYRDVKFDIPKNIEILCSSLDIDENGVYKAHLSSDLKNLKLKLTYKLKN